MTKEQAVKVSNALDNLNVFENFMAEVVDLAEDTHLNYDWKEKLFIFMESELARLNKVLEDL